MFYSPYVLRSEPSISGAMRHAVRVSVCVCVRALIGRVTVITCYALIFGHLIMDPDIVALFPPRRRSFGAPFHIHCYVEQRKISTSLIKLLYYLSILCFHHLPVLNSLVFSAFTHVVCIIACFSTSFLSVPM